MKKLVSNLLILVAISLSIVACSSDDDTVEDTNQNYGTPQMFSINARGTSTGEMLSDYKLPGTDQLVSGNAFEMPMLNPVNNEVIGTVIDINVSAETFPDGSMFAENYTVFIFNDDKESTLVLHNFIDMLPAPPAHMNAFIKKPNTINNVISGTGTYAGFHGGATLIATLDMTYFGDNTVGFNCLYGFTKKIN